MYLFFKYFPQFVACVYIFLTVSLKELKILILMKTVHYDKVWFHFWCLLTAFMLHSYLSAFSSTSWKADKKFQVLPHLVLAGSSNQVNLRQYRRTLSIVPPLKHKKIPKPVAPSCSLNCEIPWPPQKALLCVSKSFHALLVHMWCQQSWHLNQLSLAALAIYCTLCGLKTTQIYYLIVLYVRSFTGQKLMCWHAFIPLWRI